MSLTTAPFDPNLRKHGVDGQQLSYLILSDEERAKGFVRPSEMDGSKKPGVGE